jgi:hypothetical protein
MSGLRLACSIVSRCRAPFDGEPYRQTAFPERSELVQDGVVEHTALDRGRVDLVEP